MLFTKLLLVYLPKPEYAWSHQIEENVEHESDRARVGQKLGEIACQVLFDEKEIVVLEIAERGEMIE